MNAFMDTPHAMQEKVSSLILSIPKHRSNSMESQWHYIRHLITDGRQVNLDVNLEDRTLELWTHTDTPDPEDLERSGKFIEALILGFSTRVAMILMHKDDFLVETWSIEDMILELKRPVDAKRLYRNIKETKMAIEDYTSTAIVMEKSVLHVLGSSAKVNDAKEYIRHIISRYFLNIQASQTIPTRPPWCKRPEHTPVGQTILTQHKIKPETLCLTHTIPNPPLLLSQPIRLQYFEDYSLLPQFSSIVL